MNDSKKMMPGCPLDIETSSVNEYEVIAQVEAVARKSECYSVHLIATCQGVNLVGNETETLQSLLYGLLSLTMLYHEHCMFPS